MKILASSDGPIGLVKTGFARVMDKVCHTLSKQGWQVDLICHNYDGAPILNYLNSGYNLFPGNVKDSSVREVFKFISSPLKEKYDYFINIADIWRISYTSLFKNGFDYLNLPFELVKWCLYAEIDGIGTHEYGLGKGYFETFSISDFVVVPTKFAGKLLDEAGFDHLVIPHTVNTEVFYPESKEHKLLQRERMGIDENDFVIGTVGVPAKRKGWNEILYALRVFLDSLPKNEQERIKLYMHTDVNCQIDHLDLPSLITMFDLNQNIIAPDLRMGQYISDDQLRQIYSVFDCFLSCSKIEGFNIPLIEAGACGCPVIATNYASHPEVIKGFGELIDVVSFSVNSSDIKMANVSIQHTAKLLKKFFNSRALRDKYSRKGPKLVKKKFGDDQNLKWIELLENFDEFANQNIQRLVI